MLWKGTNVAKCDGITLSFFMQNDLAAVSCPTFSVVHKPRSVKYKHRILYTQILPDNKESLIYSTVIHQPSKYCLKAEQTRAILYRLNVSSKNECQGGNHTLQDIRLLCWFITCFHLQHDSIKHQQRSASTGTQSLIQ